MQTSPNPLDQWVSSFTVEPGDPGVAIVELRLKNAVLGDLPPVFMKVDWKPGMEIEDVRRFFAAQIAVSAKHLGEAVMAAV
ncbi:hypothetical protein [Caulobacter endophyticus]|uniref:Uncharacterized protein n=1 Tax=Caulobacter endophyticus TaxID=2172652 RepID=A0A2T9K402_9CAUL|nr:hypothetical protein [Caulobacter endophyticus]PVM90677.1 hypothetical protein DDF67_09615 [Caulobacter endophyticus]